MLAEFPSAIEAVRCAVELQGVLRGRNATLPRERRMEFRVGVHLGDVAFDGERLYEQASRAYGEGRWAAAAEYARHAVALFPVTEPRRAELLCVRGEALLRSGHPREARDAFTEVVERAPGDPHRAQALFSGAAAKETIGDADGAALWRRRLREEFPGNPWTERLERDRQR